MPAICLLLLCSCNRHQEVLKSFQFIAEANQTVFLQTKEHFKLEYDSSATGVFVKSIEAIPQTKTSYWLYFVNGNSAKTSAEKFIPAAGDTIEWRLISAY